MKRRIKVHLGEPGGKDRADRTQRLLQQAVRQTGEPDSSVDMNFVQCGDGAPTGYWYVTSQKVWDEFVALGGEA
jgi:hypothetical protein